MENMENIQLAQWQIIKEAMTVEIQKVGEQGDRRGLEWWAGFQRRMQRTTEQGANIIQQWEETRKGLEEWKRFQKNGGEGE
jgi:hypothetical protein